MALWVAGFIGFLARIFSVVAKASDLADRAEALIVLLAIAVGGPASAAVVLGGYIEGAVIGAVGSLLGTAAAEMLLRVLEALARGFRFSL